MAVRGVLSGFFSLFVQVREGTMAVRGVKNPALGLKNSRGVAVVEMLFLLVVFVVLFGLTFGLWTSIHRGTLQSIAARHYAFEVINHRTNFIYHRDNEPPDTGDKDKNYYQKNGNRFFAVVDEQPVTRLKLQPKERELSLFNKSVSSFSRESRPATNKASPIWLKAGYGICLNFECGGL